MAHAGGAWRIGCETIEAALKQPYALPPALAGLEGNATRSTVLDATVGEVRKLIEARVSVYS